MVEMSQGDEYVEEGDNADTSQEGAEDTGGDKIFGIDKKIFVIGVIAFVFIVIFLIVLLMFKNRGSSNEYEDDDFDIDNWIASQQTQQSAQSGVVQQSQQNAFSSTVYSSDWSSRYTINGNSYSDGLEVKDKSGTIVGTFSTVSGDPLVDSSGNRVGYLQSSGSADGSSLEVSSSGTMVSDADTVLLRKLGYTGDEIEFAKANGISIETLVTEAEALRDEEASEALVRMSDSLSDEFRFVYDNSIISFGEVPYVSMKSLSLEGSRVKTGNYTVNADFEKMPTYGLRLYFKVKIANGTYIFMDVTPDQWDKYPDSGNIIVRVFYTTYQSDSVEPHLYITDIQEVDITNLTVNPEDSGIDLNKAVGLE